MPLHHISSINMSLGLQLKTRNQINLKVQRSSRLTNCNFDCVTYHDKAVAYPQEFPSCWTIWHNVGLTVNCNNVGWYFAHHTSAKV